MPTQPNSTDPRAPAPLRDRLRAAGHDPVTRAWADRCVVLDPEQPWDEIDALVSRMDSDLVEATMALIRLVGEDAGREVAALAVGRRHLEPVATMLATRSAGRAVEENGGLQRIVVEQVIDAVQRDGADVGEAAAVLADIAPGAVERLWLAFDDSDPRRGHEAFRGVRARRRLDEAGRGPARPLGALPDERLEHEPAVPWPALGHWVEEARFAGVHPDAISTVLVRATGLDWQPPEWLGAAAWGESTRVAEATGGPLILGARVGAAARGAAARVLGSVAPLPAAAELADGTGVERAAVAGDAVAQQILLERLIAALRLRPGAALHLATVAGQISATALVVLLREAWLRPDLPDDVRTAIRGEATTGALRAHLADLVEPPQPLARGLRH